MIRVTDSLPLPDAARGAVLAIGNFDGVHRGHQAVIALAAEEAARRGTLYGVLTFEPHPRQYFADLKGVPLPPFRLMNAGAKTHQLENMGVPLEIQHPFTAELAGLSAQEFAREVLVEQHGASHVVVGQDFYFGAGRSGDVTTLAALGETLGFGVTIADLVEFDGLEISSTAIRKALSEGNPRLAREMLGHWHRINGIVEHGEKRGRELGYPTANLSIKGLHPPKFGVYASLITIYDGPHAGMYHGASSIGVRPMFNGEIPNCETYIFDFDGDIYGQDISVALVDYLRPELKFDGLDGLIAQMQADCDQARAILADV